MIVMTLTALLFLPTTQAIILDIDNLKGFDFICQSEEFQKLTLKVRVFSEAERELINEGSESIPPRHYIGTYLYDGKSFEFTGKEAMHWNAEVIKTDVQPFELARENDIVNLGTVRFLGQSQYDRISKFRRDP